MITIATYVLTGKGTIVAVFDLPTSIRRIGSWSISGFRLGSFGTSKTLAHADAERPRTLHQNENVPRGR